MATTYTGPDLDEGKVRKLVAEKLLSEVPELGPDLAAAMVDLEIDTLATLYKGGGEAPADALRFAVWKVAGDHCIEHLL